MKEENKKDRETLKIKSDIEVAFSRIIGPLVIMKTLDSYQEEHKEIQELLNIIAKWGAEFQIKENLNFISREELLDVYYRLDKLKERFLFDTTLGNENELSDEIVIWMWEIMELRKKQIEGEK